MRACSISTPGTGSLGIEALSRGAARAIFVEQEPEAAQCIRENLAHCHLANGDVQTADVLAYLKTPPREKFDLIFADPPYIKSRGALDDDPLLELTTTFLAPGGLFVWEHYAERKLENSTRWEVIRHRNYGETGLSFLRVLA